MKIDERNVINEKAMSKEGTVAGLSCQTAHRIFRFWTLPLNFFFCIHRKLIFFDETKKVSTFVTFFSTFASIEIFRQASGWTPTCQWGSRPCATSCKFSSSGRMSTLYSPDKKSRVCCKVVCLYFRDGLLRWVLPLLGSIQILTTWLPVTSQPAPQCQMAINGLAH